MAAEVGISASSVQRIWRDNDLKPHLRRTFKLSNDKRFEEKFWDVIGLYLNPPDKALVLCCDEKTQCQALERTQPLDFRWASVTSELIRTTISAMVRSRCLPP